MVLRKICELKLFLDDRIIKELFKSKLLSVQKKLSELGDFLVVRCFFC